MSRAFVKEADDLALLPDRPISPHRNLVTGRGRQRIEAAIARHRGELARATAAADREAVGRASRELRYWSARAATAEIVAPDPDAASVVFGTAVTLRRADRSEVTYRLVGEDEADPDAGRLAWTTPVARALLGAAPGEIRELPAGEVAVLAIDATPEPIE